MKKTVLIFVLLTASIFSFALVNADYVSPVENVVQAAGPAVVKVDVELTQEVSPLDSFSEEFFRRFFGEIPPDSQRKVEGLGSGFIVNKEGYILTNEHVVGSADKISVTLLDGSKYEAKYVGGDDELDIAVIKIDPADKDLPVVELGSSDDLNIGEWAIAIGNPLGFQHTVTVGVVSAVGRQIPKPDGQSYYSNLIQTDAAINPGNSGGPLLNIRGQVIAINTAIISPEYGTNLGFAIPIDTVKRFLDAIIETGTVQKAYLGVYFTSVTEENQKSLGLKTDEGALVTGIVPDSPAAKAGIKEQDVVIGINGLEVKNDKELVAAIHNYPAGSTVSIKVNRFGELINLDITLVSRTEIETSDEFQAEGAYTHKELGLELNNLLPEDYERLSIPQELKGVLVTGIMENSVAATLGVQKDDVITRISINGQQSNIMNVKDYQDLVKGLRKGDYVALFITRGEIRFIASFKY